MLIFVINFNWISSNIAVRGILLIQQKKMNQLALSKYFAILSGVPGEKKPHKTKQKRMSRYKCNETNSNMNPANEKCISVDARGHMRSVKIYE